MRFDALDAIRGLGAIVIVLGHSAFFTLGETPSRFVNASGVLVDMFFMLSGFVIAHAYLDKVVSGGTGWREFLLLRAGRLYPLHLFLLMVWVAFILAKYGAYQLGIGSRDPLVVNSLEEFVAQLFLANSFFGTESGGWNFPSWSISAEAVAYTAFFAYVSFAGALLRTVWMPLAIAAAGYGFLCVSFPDDINRIYDFGFLRGVAGFFVGVAIFRLARWRSLLPTGVLPRTAVEVFFMALAIMLVGLSGDSLELHFASLLALALMVWMLAGTDGGYLSRLLGLKPFTTLGDWSYSIYMVHALVIQVAHNVTVYLLHVPETAIEMRPDVWRRAVVLEDAALINAGLVLVVIGISALTFRYIEHPWRERFRGYARATRARRG